MKTKYRIIAIDYRNTITIMSDEYMTMEETMKRIEYMVRAGNGMLCYSILTCYGKDLPADML